jgi:hypothetical protein
MPADAPASAKPSASEARDDWFRATPDPWDTIASLDYGADRTFASTVRSMIVNAEPAQRPVMETKLLQTLAKPSCTPAGRAFVCHLLALIGSAQCVPALAPLLRDPATADDARYALEPIAEPAVDEAFRAALGVLTGPAKAGLIGSIALRGDRQATAALATIEQNASEPAAVRAAATRALQRLRASS